MFSNGNNSNNLGVVNSQKSAKYGGKMADLTIRSSKFLVSVNYNSEPREQVFLKGMNASHNIVVFQNGIKILNKKGVWSEEISFNDIEKAFGAIKP